MRRLLALTLVLSAPAEAYGAETVRSITDGDTFRLTSGERIRIAGIDAPETDPRQARCTLEVTRGKAAKAVLGGLISGKNLRIKRVGRSYNRTVATVRVGARDLAASLIAAGAAKPWPRGRPKPDWCK